ncbi:MAG: DUF1294 domain-containing protein [Bacillota bacterium]|nr:DUF1294 domain-containing protein [Bacillota bacterium]
MEQRLLWVYLVIINIAAFTAFAVDKRRAVKAGRRLRNRTLLGLAFFGGSAGAYIGMYLFRHKTKRAVYVAGVPLMLLFHAEAVLILWKWGERGFW